MTLFSRARNLTAIVVVACAANAAASAAPPGDGSRVCQWSKATTFRAAGDRYNAMKRFTLAAHWYAAASRQTRDCQTALGSMLTARSLAQAGTAYAQSGDLLRALRLLQESQSLLVFVEARDRATAPAARAYSDLVKSVISAIDDVAESSM